MDTVNIRVNVMKSGRKYCCSYRNEYIGLIIVISKTLKEFKTDFAESLKFSIEGCIEDGDDVPEYLAKGNYNIVYELAYKKR